MFVWCDANHLSRHWEEAASTFLTSFRMEDIVARMLMRLRWKTTSSTHILPLNSLINLLTNFSVITDSNHFSNLIRCNITVWQIVFDGILA